MNTAQKTETAYRTPLIGTTNNQATLIAEAVADLCGWDWDTICETETPELEPSKAEGR